jgi:hypothetical protein
MHNTAFLPEQLNQLAELIADRVVEQLQREPTDAGKLIDAAEVARRFSLSRDYVYEHADDLDAVRLGDGPRARLRFDPVTVGERLRRSSGQEPSQHKVKPVRTVRKGRDDTLLPIRGESP